MEKQILDRRVKILGWLELIMGCLASPIFIFFLLLSIGISLDGGLNLQSLIIIIPVAIITIPLPLFLWAGLGVIRQNRWGLKINLILTPIMELWLVMALLIGGFLFSGADDLFNKLLIAIPVLFIAIGLVINLLVLKFLPNQE